MQCVDAPRDVSCTHPLYSLCPKICARGIGERVHIHGVGAAALPVLDGEGQCEGLGRKERVDGKAPTLFFVLGREN